MINWRQLIYRIENTHALATYKATCAQLNMETKSKRIVRSLVLCNWWCVIVDGIWKWRIDRCSIIRSFETLSTRHRPRLCRPYLERMGWKHWRCSKTMQQFDSIEIQTDHCGMVQQNAVSGWNTYINKRVESLSLYTSRQNMKVNKTKCARLCRLNAKQTRTTATSSQASAEVWTDSTKLQTLCETISITMEKMFGTPCLRRSHNMLPFGSQSQTSECRPICF